MSACFFFVCGVALASLYDIRLPGYSIVLVSSVGVSFLWMFWKQQILRVCIFLSLLFFFGMIRYRVAFPSIDIVSETTTLTGYVSKEPDVRQDKVNYVVTIENADTKKNIQSTLLHKRVLVSSELYPRYHYGDVLKLRCRLTQPEPIEDFRYDRYLARMNIFIICQDPHITQIGSHAGNVLFRQLFVFKEQIAKRIRLLWHEPYAGFMAGLLYGYRGGLGTLNELFAITGVTHIIAISGYNITLISTILITSCSYLRIPRKKAFWLVSVGIMVFVIFVGASASVVRAGIMGLIVLLARQLGRKSSMLPTILFGAALMVAHNPLILFWDAGFQLSFLATLGLVYISPLIDKLLTALPDYWGIKETAVSTISATLVTLPLLLFQFHRFSVVAVIVNVLVLWILPYAMLSGFITVVFTMISTPIASILSWISWALMHYVVWVVTFFAQLPYASLMITLPWWGMVGMYSVLLYGVYRYSRV